MNHDLKWRCSSCKTLLLAETTGAGCFPFPKISCPVCGSAQSQVVLTTGLYILWYHKEGNGWIQFQITEKMQHRLCDAAIYP
jgi:hypothetical protein